MTTEIPIMGMALQFAGGYTRGPVLCVACGKQMKGFGPAHGSLFSVRWCSNAVCRLWNVKVLLEHSTAVVLFVECGFEDGNPVWPGGHHHGMRVVPKREGEG